MPTYEYKCPQCGRFEQFQSIKDDPLPACPECGSPVQRLISNNVNIIFKGSGWHITDYRGDSYKKEAKAEKEAESGGSKGSSSGGASAEVAAG